MADDLEALVLTISADTRQIQRALNRLVGDTKSATDEVEKAFKKTEPAVDNVAKAMRRSRGDVANLSAQFQDIAVQLAGGQSPFLIALQQGTQISAVLGSGAGGAGGAVKALGAAFLSVISPISLATVAAIALGGAVLQYLTSAGEMESVEDRLKAQADLLNLVKERFGETSEAAKAFATENASVLRTQLEASIQKLLVDYRELQVELLKVGQVSQSVGDIAGGGATGFSVETAAPKYEAFRTAIEGLANAAGDSTTRFRDFRDAVAAIAQASSEPRIKELANELIRATDAGFRTEQGIAAAERAIRTIGDAASGQVSGVQALTSALDQLAKIGVPSLTDGQRALKIYQDALAKAGDAEDRRALEAGYIAARDRAATEAGKEVIRGLSSKSGGGGGKSRRDVYAEELREIENTARALEMEIALLGKSAGEREKARAIMEAENALRKEGVVLTAAQRGELEKEAAKIQEFYNRLKEGKNRIAELNEASAELGSTLASAFLDAAKNGKSLSAVVDKFLDRLLTSSVEGLFGILFNAPRGGGLSPFASFLSGIFGRAGGGPVQAGRPYEIGERGKELFVPNVAGRIIPNHALRAGAGQAPIINVMNAPGRPVTRRGPNGRPVIDIYPVADAVGGSLVGRGRGGQGPFASILGSDPAYGVG